MLKVIELFAGIGAQRKTLQKAKIEHEVIAISEIDKYAILSYNAINGETPNLGDITKIGKIPKADLWTYTQIGVFVKTKVIKSTYDTLLEKYTSITLGSSYEGSNATCPQIIVFNYTVARSTYSTIDLNVYVINEIICASLIEKDTASIGSNNQWFSIDKKKLTIHNTTGNSKTYSVIVIAV